MQSYRGIHCTMNKSYCDSKYYYPSVEEINVGDDLEYLSSYGYVDENDDKNWIKLTIGVNNNEDPKDNVTFPHYDILEYLADGCDIARVPLIGQKDFKDEGFIFKTKNHVRYWYEKDNMFIEAPDSPEHQILATTIIHDPEYKTIQIECKLRSDFKFHRFFEGYCRTANEFRKILRMLGLNYTKKT